MGKLQGWMFWWRHATYRTITTLKSEHMAFFNSGVICLTFAGFVTFQNGVLAPGHAVAVRMRDPTNVQRSFSNARCNGVYVTPLREASDNRRLEVVWVLIYTAFVLVVRLCWNHHYHFSRVSIRQF
jgi:hypothetical protein